MAMLTQDVKSEEGSYLCILCKNKKRYDVHLLEGKKCTEENFVSKMTNLVTKSVYENLCSSLKSHNNRNYVCRSCFLMILNTHDNILRLQTGLAKSTEKRLRALETQNEENEPAENVVYQPLDIKRRKNSRFQNARKEELGRHGISSLKLVCVNNIYPKLILRHCLLHSNGYFLGKKVKEKASSLEPGDTSSNGSLSFDNGVNRSGKSDGNYPEKNYHYGENAFLSKHRNFERENRLGLESLINAAKFVEEQRDQSDIYAQSLDNIINKIKVSQINKPGPLSWKQKTNRPVLPDKFEQPDSIQVKNLIVKSLMPINLARLRNNNIHMCTETNCGWIFVSSFSLNNHIKHFHYSGRPHQCPDKECGKTFCQRSKLKEHMKSHSGEKPFVCSTCGRGFSHSANLKHHAATHSEKDEKNYKCPRPGCNQAYKYPHTLKRHLEFHDGGALPFKCTHPGCEKAYKNKYELKCHFRHHTGEKPYKCDEPGCGKSFRLPGQYTIHRRNHKGERPFKCSWKGCEAAYSSRGQLENHVLSHKGKTFICDTCGKAFTYKVALVIHRKKMHTNERDYVCQVDGCNKAFHFRFALNAHVTKVHNAKHLDKKGRVARGSKKIFLLYPCPILGCRKEYVAKRNIEKHLLQVHNLTDFKVEPKTRLDFLTCPVDGCESQFLTERNLRYHKMLAHNPLSVRYKRVYGGKRFTCTFEGCKRVYETMNAMREHVARVHMSVPKEKMCFLCGAAFKHIQQLEIHRQVMHGEDSVLNEQKAGIYVCKAEACGMQFSSPEYLKHHVHVHMENPPYRCIYPGCRRAFLIEKTFRSHSLIHSNLKPYSCSHNGCGEKFSTQFQVLKHSINHYGSYRCPVESCEKMLLSLNSARVHMFRHTGEKPYICSICGMAFAVSSNWLRHKRTHTGEKPFECKICLKRFSDKAVLTTHIRRHTGDKPYVCSICGQCFASMSGIKIHMRLHTGEFPYVCNEVGCNKRFRDISGLKSHKNVHTKASHLCSQCGKVYKWGIKKHKCKIPPEPIASSCSSSVSTATKARSNQQQQQHQQQNLHHQQVQDQQHFLRQDILKQGQQQLQPFSLLLQQQQQHQDQEMSQQQQQQQLQQSMQLTHPAQFQLQPSQTLTHLPTDSSLVKQPQQQQAQQIHIASILQQQQQQQQHPLQQQIPQHQQSSIAILQALQQQQHQQQQLHVHQPQQLQHQVSVPASLNPSHTQAPYVMGNMMMMPDLLHPGLTYIRDSTMDPSLPSNSEGASVVADPLVMHDLDSNHRVLYDQSLQQ